MNADNRQLLENEIKDELEALENMEIGTEEYKLTIDSLTKLLDRSIELDKIEANSKDKDKDRNSDRDLKIEQRVADVELRTEQLRNEKTDRLITNGIAIAGIIIPTFVTIWGTYKTLNFEKEGTVTTIMGRGFINKLLPKK